MRTFWARDNKQFYHPPVHISHEVYFDNNMWYVYMDGRMERAGFGLRAVEDAVARGDWIEKEIPDDMAFKPKNNHIRYGKFPNS